MTALLESARQAARSFQLPFGARSWRGRLGNWGGTGAGSSVDFQDHRPYAPGDDPRYIDWLAYARSEHYVMKLYREEVTPAIDLVLDGSSSMAYDELKRKRSLEIFYFALESAGLEGSSIHPWFLDGGGAASLDPGRMRSGDDPFDRAAPFRVDLPLLESLTYRPGSLRVLVTDCLFPGAPDGFVRKLASEKGRGVVFAPYCAAESSPDWSGYLELRDCESEMRRVERFDSERVLQYQASYRRHFQLWESACRRYGVAFSQLPAAATFLEALHRHALPAGAVQPSS